MMKTLVLVLYFIEDIKLKASIILKSTCTKNLVKNDMYFLKRLCTDFNRFDFSKLYLSD